MSHLRRPAPQAELPHSAPVAPLPAHYDRSILRDYSVTTLTHNLWIPSSLTLKEASTLATRAHISDIRSYNLPSALDHPEVVDDYLVQECLQGRMAGPFAEAPFHPFHCSGMGVVPKQDGSWQVITHLSAPGGLSVNDFIDPESVTLSYTTIDTAQPISLSC